MKYLVYGDVHWYTNSSILRSRGEHYSTRLENLIDSLNFVESFAQRNNIDEIVCLGDFFNSPTVTAEELSALKEVKWASDIKHTFIVGNHDADSHSLEFNSTNALSLVPKCSIIDCPKTTVLSENGAKIGIVYLPYITERDREPLTNYLPKNVDSRIIFSHNDISGLQYGAYKSKDGFKLDEINGNCDYYLNGHIHSHYRFIDNSNTIGINVGNLTGLNFGDADCNHYIYIVDSETNSISKPIPNPYAIIFRKIDETSIDFVKKSIDNLQQLSVVTVKCQREDLQEITKILENNKNVIAYKTIVVMNTVNVDTPQMAEKLTINHIEEFSKYIIGVLGNSDVVLEELGRVTK